MHRIDSTATTLILDDGGTGLPRIAHWGARLSQNVTERILAADRGRPLPQGGLDMDVPLSILPEAGTGFMGHPGLTGRNSCDGWLTQFVVENAHTSTETITVTGRDECAGLEVVIVLSLDDATNVLTTRTQLTNVGSSAYTLDWIAAGAWPLPTRVTELLTLEGRWGREFQIRRQPFPDQMLMSDNRTGRTSHHSFPGLVAGTAAFSEQAGEVFGFHLGWSGNHRWLVERLRDGRQHVQLGELLLPGEIVLEAGESYNAPPAYAAWSDGGLSGMAADWHRFVRARILGSAKHSPRPVHANTWEAFYFDHEPHRLSAFADRAAALGCERFVLDDGWFFGRYDDQRGLGDWTVDHDKYPEGLGALVAHVNRLGMTFGLWIEPEMVNRDSNLFRKHPDWILALPKREQPIGRHQYVLDLARPEVTDYLYACLDALLSEHPITYLKWDMNRDLTHPGHHGKPSVHHQTLSLYALLDRLRAAHPRVEIESCSSGGARADFGILQRTDRIWVSDCNDAVERQAIHAGFGLFFPPEVMGAHLGPNPSHTTGRIVDFDFQGATALFGHFGLELDVTTLTDDDAEIIADWIALYKDWRDHLHGGETIRLDADEADVVAHGVASPNRRRALYAYARQASARALVPPPLRLAGLEHNQNYRVRLLNRPKLAGFGMREMAGALSGDGSVFSGEWLSRVGVQLPIVPPQCATLITADAVD